MGKGLIACFCAVALVCMEAPGAISQLHESGLGPRVRSALGDVWDLSRITITFTDDVVGAFDPFYYYIEDINNAFISVNVTNVAYGVSSNVIVLTLEGPRDPNIIYNLIITGHSIQDRYGYPLADPTTVRVTVPMVFQNGTAGYFGTEDTEVRFSAPESTAPGEAPILITDGQDGTPAGAVHGLLRFDYFVGLGPGQVPLGATISKATVRFYTDDPSDPGTPVRMLRMLAPWDENSTWNSLGNGIDQTNGVEAGATDALIVADMDERFIEIDVTAPVQAWVNGQPNYGWAFLPTGPNGWRWASSENAIVERRPALLIEDWYEPPICVIIEQPQSVTVYGGDPVTLRVVSLGADLHYQWYKNQMLIPGATSSIYQIPLSKPADSGSYFVVVQSAGPVACSSQVAQVTVICDTYHVSLLSAVGNSDQNTITLLFNARLDPVLAQNTNNYAISGGLGIVSARVDSNQVTLTTTGPRVKGRNYTLTISNLRDASCFNTLYPNPTVTTLLQELRILSFDAIWRYHNEGVDLGTAWRLPYYDDSTWAQGRGLLGFEMTTSTLMALSNQNAFVNTVLNLTSPTGQPIITDYFRTAVDLQLDLTQATFIIRHVVDDGAVFYFNGTEVARFNMPSGPIIYGTVAPNPLPEGVVRSITNLTGLVCGLNSIAVEVHNQAPTSGDILFGAEIIARIPLFVAPTCGIGIRIIRNGNAGLILDWNPGSMRLQEADSLTGPWRYVSGATRPWRVTPTGASRFYRLTNF